MSVSIPESLFRASADLARRLGMTRSMLFGRAIEEYLGNHADDVNINPLIKQHVEPVLVEEMARGENAVSVSSEAPAIPLVAGTAASVISDAPAIPPVAGTAATGPAELPSQD